MSTSADDADESRQARPDPGETSGHRRIGQLAQLRASAGARARSRTCPDLRIIERDVQGTRERATRQLGPRSRPAEAHIAGSTRLKPREVERSGANMTSLLKWACTRHQWTCPRCLPPRPSLRQRWAQNINACPPGLRPSAQVQGIGQLRKTCARGERGIVGAHPARRSPATHSGYKRPPHVKFRGGGGKWSSPARTLSCSFFHRARGLHIEPDRCCLQRTAIIPAASYSALGGPCCSLLVLANRKGCQVKIH